MNKNKEKIWKNKKKIKEGKNGIKIEKIKKEKLIRNREKAWKKF